MSRAPRRRARVCNKNFIRDLDMNSTTQATTAKPSARRAAALGVLLALAVGLLNPTGQAANADVLFHVVANTSALPNGTAGILDFQFNPGGAGADAATATVTNFKSTAITLGSAGTDGGGSGALPGPLVINNSGQLNDVFQNVTYGSGSGFSFDVTLSGPAVNNPTHGNPIGTSFFLSVVDSSFFPFPQFNSADPVLEIDLNGGSGKPVVSLVVTPPIVSVTTPTPPAVVVPEPSSLALLALGGCALAGWRRWRKRAAA
jgi:hypothetical protein